MALQFAEYLKGEGLTAGTIEQYTAFLRRYDAFLQPNSLLSGTHETLSVFLETRYVNGPSGKGRGMFLMALRHFYRFAISMGYTDADLTVGYPRSWEGIHSLPVPRAEAMVPQCRPNAPIIDAFQCSECEWSYVIPAPEPYLIDPEQAERAYCDFDRHRCRDFKPRNNQSPA